MEYRLLGDSGLKVSALCFGTGTFGGGTEFFKAWGSTGVEEAKRLIGLCLDAGVNIFDKPTVSSVIIGARNEEQLRQNLGAAEWSLTPEQVARLDEASEQTLPYPYWRQRQFIERNPPPPPYV